MIEAFAFSIAALAFLTRHTDDDRLPFLPAIALGGIALVGLIQLLPGSTLSPTSARVYDQANSVMRLFGRPAITPHISIAPGETKATILLTLAYAALFTAGAVLTNSRRRRRWLVAALLLSMTLHLLVYAAITGPSERLHGAFVNANHFSGYLEIGLAFGFGLIWNEVLTGRKRVEGIANRGERLERRTLPFLWRIMVWGVVAAGIALTRSRGGVIAAGFMMVTVVIMGFMRQRGDRASIVAVIGLLLGVVFVALTTGEAAVMRLAGSDPRDITSEERVQIWRSSVDAWQLFPHFGAGLGAFKEAFRRVQPHEIYTMVDYAHNDFLQLLVTSGWIGAALGLLAFGSLYLILLRGWLRQAHRDESAFILAAFGALLAICVHDLVDFNLSLPATAATLAVMMGAAVRATRYRT